MDRVSRVAVTCVAVISIAGCTAASERPESPGPMSVPPATPTSEQDPIWPPLPKTVTEADFTRSLGVFATVDQAIAAAKAAGLAPGKYVTATVDLYVLAIDGDGTVYLGGQIAGSGNGQRPPTPPTGQQ